MIKDRMRRADVAGGAAEPGQPGDQIGGQDLLARREGITPSASLVIGPNLLAAAAHRRDRKRAGAPEA